MKYAFDVKDKPGLFKALQHKAIRLGKTWPAGNWLQGAVIRDLSRGHQFFLFDLHDHFFNCFAIHRFDASHEDERRRRRRDELTQQGYIFDQYEDYFGLEEPPTDPSPASARDLIGIEIAQNDLVRRICMEKATLLGLACYEHASPGSAVLDAFRGEYWEHSETRVQFNGHFDSTYRNMRWVGVGEFLRWRRVLSEKSALKAFGEMFESYDHVPFMELLSDRFSYPSQWVMEENDSKLRFLEYIKGNLATVRRANHRVSAEMVEWNGRPCLILHQSHVEEAPEVAVTARVTGDEISGIFVQVPPRPEETRPVH